MKNATALKWENLPLVSRTLGGILWGFPSAHCTDTDQLITVRSKTVKNAMY